MRRSDAGGAFLEYGALFAVVALIFGGAAITDLPTRVADICVTAICQFIGGQDCGEIESADAEDDHDEAHEPVDLPSPTTPVRPPVDKPGCADPDAEWTEGLHAHNDYENGTALTDALDNGAVSVEADVFIENEDGLRVRHDEHGASRGTLRSLYIDPLIERAEENGGEIYPGRDEPFQLVVEIKEQHDGDDINRCDEADDGDKRCEAYRRAFEHVEDLPPGVEVVFSGGPPPEDLVGAQPANSTFDIEPGPGCTLPDRVNFDSPDYDRVYAQHFSMLNGQWGKDECGDKDGDYDISEQEQQDLNAVVDQAHRSGLRVRFWGAPDGNNRSPLGFGNFLPCMPWEDKCKGDNREEAWAAQLEAGVDFYNTNHLTQASNWIRSCGDGF